MKAVIVCLLGVLAIASATGGWSNWGSCGGPPQCVQTRTCSGAACNGTTTQTQSCFGDAPSGCAADSNGWTAFGACTHLCGGGSQTRACVPGHTCTVGSATQNCNTFQCVDCQFTDLSGYSQCPVQCGGGINSRTRTIKTPPSPGGAACPPTIVYYPCNTWYCGDVMNGFGYYAWGPIAGTGQQIVVSVEAWQYAVDIFVFNNYNYQQYQEDTLRTPPYNYGYLPVDSRLNIQNAKFTVTLPAGDQYWVVIDNTNIGAANGNGNNQFTQLNFNYKIADPQGVQLQTLPPPLNTAGAFTVAPVLLSILALIAVAFNGPRHLL